MAAAWETTREAELNQVEAGGVPKLRDTYFREARGLAEVAGVTFHDDCRSAHSELLGRALKDCSRRAYAFRSRRCKSSTSSTGLDRPNRLLNFGAR